MNRKKSVTLFLGLIFIFFSETNAFFRHFGESDDPLSRINYANAFDQKNISKKFEGLMRKWGCYKNVCDDDSLSSDLTELATETSPAEIAEYHKACLAQLQSARLQCLTADTRTDLIHLGILGGLTLAVCSILPKDSLGGSFSIHSGAMSLSYSLPMIIRTLYNLIRPPANSLAALEDYFAKEKCFIPKELYPAIIQKFTLARTNQFEHQASINFLQFALGLTLYKPKPPLSREKDKGLETIQEKILFQRIDDFFADYDLVSPQDMWMLKNNIYTFILALLDSKNRLPRYLYFHGAGGTGKTYFVNKLYEWIEELIPGSINFENLIITTSEELEGSVRRPSALLRVLRNQLLENKRGSLVFMDEATWLNRLDMMSSAKRIFNGNQTHLSTDYFGNNIEGGGIELETPPILICLACNKDIEDQALKARFDTITFPTPKKETLVNHARKIASENPLINQKRRQDFDFNAWFEKNQFKNFRDIESQIVPAILAAT